MMEVTQQLEQETPSYLRRKHALAAKIQQLQIQRQEQLSPSRLFLPAPWQPVLFSKPTTMFKVIAAAGGKFTSVYDARVEYQLQQWTHARCCGAWPPLWSCLYAFPTVAQARAAVFPRGSQQQQGARVLVRVKVLGQGYQHPSDGRVAVSSLLLDQLIEYVPKMHSRERIVHLEYQPGGAVVLSNAAAATAHE